MGEAKIKAAAKAAAAAPATEPGASAEPAATPSMTPEQGRRLVDDLIAAHRLQARIFALMAPKQQTDIGAAMRDYVRHVDAAFPGPGPKA